MTPELTVYRLYQEILTEMRESMQCMRDNGATVIPLSRSDLCELFKAACIASQNEEQVFILN